MDVVNWPHVREVIINDFQGMPNLRYLKRITRILPDCRIHGFGLMYDRVTWYLVIESQSFPYHVEMWGTRAAIQATSLSQYLGNKTTTGSNI